METPLRDFVDLTTPRPLVEVSGYDEVGEAWRCPHLTTRMVAPIFDHFQTGSVNALDGPAHATRRRAIGQLLKARGHQYFRDTYLFPTADQALRKILDNPDPDGLCRMDAVAWSKQVNQRLGAGFVGFDGATDEEGGRRLGELMEIYMLGRASSREVATGRYSITEDIAAAAIVARDQILDEFYEPARARRELLLKRVESGEIGEDELPQDLVMLMVRKVDPAWADEEAAKREVMAMMSASIRTTTHVLTYSLQELFEWLRVHPEDEAALTDDQFIANVAQEAMRLHPPIPAVPRAALVDVELSHGTRIPADSIAIIRMGPSSSEAAVFGADGEDFNPRRTVPRGVNRFGYAFGAGPHMCVGLPIVMGSNGIDGSVAYLLKSLLGAGGRLDPSHPSDVDELVEDRGSKESTKEVLRRFREIRSLHMVFPGREAAAA